MTFLINGTAIDYLCEIPDGCSILFVNQLVKCEFWQNFSLFHRIPPLKPHQLNCFQYLINSRFRPFEINQILTDQKVVRAILSECESTEIKELFRSGLNDLGRLNFAVFSKFLSEILQGCDAIEVDYENMSYVPLVNWEQEMQENQYSRFVDKILDHVSVTRGNKQIFQRIIQTDDKIKDFYQNEDDAKASFKGEIAELLNAQIASNQKLMKFRKMKINQEKLNFKDRTVESKNFIQLNVGKLGNSEDKIKDKIESRYPSLCELNIPELEKKYTFTRKDLHTFYAKYKALV